MADASHDTKTCPYCAETIKAAAIICKHCGNDVTVDPQKVAAAGVAIDRFDALQESKKPEVGLTNNLTRCQVCGVEADTGHVEFGQNIGMLVVRKYRKVKGRLCKSCINEYFWKFTITSLFLGWWGTISFFVTALLMLNNPFYYLRSLGMKPVPVGVTAPILTAIPVRTTTPILTAEAVARLTPAGEDIAQMLRSNHSIEDISIEISRNVGVTPEQVILYIRA